MHQRTRRILFFGIAILVGLAAGVFYGWEVNPIRQNNTAPNELRMDYKADIVLMAAERYHAEGDIAAAITNLVFLGNTPPLDMIEDAIAFAERNQYALDDVQLMRQLLTAIDDTPVRLE